MSKDFGGRYILDGRGKPKPEPDLLKWAKWFEEGGNRRVASDTVNGKMVSTVFLGLDHSFGHGEPLLYETMVFGTEDDMAERYHTREEALEGHQRILDSLR